MQELRAMMNKLEAEDGRDHQLTSAVGAGRSKIEKIDYAAVSKVVDNIFMMSYASCINSMS
ncbi:MAG: chitinase [Alteromonadaceae bacterium]|jgi:chitinase